MQCPQCRKVLTDDARFCYNCGYSITESTLPNRQADSFNENTLSDPLIGHLIDTKYQLGARLGEGGMGTVYRARRVHIGDEVAIKILHTKYVHETEAVERFRREARAAAQLHHPNVVAIYDFGEARSERIPAYIVMELVEGTSLRELLRREVKLGPPRAVALMRDICAGVGAAHRRDIVHRDLKPDNIIVLPAGADHEREVAKVVDFGIAKLRDLAGAATLTLTGAIMGTPYYMSPEQCRGESLDARSDVYSLGAMLYEMLSGVLPLVATTPAAMIAKHLTEEPPPLPTQRGLPPALGDVVMRALAKDPNARQADATVLSRELQIAIEPPATRVAAPVFNDDVATITQESSLAPFPTVQSPPATIQATPQTLRAEVSSPQPPDGPSIAPFAAYDSSKTSPRSSRAGLTVGLVAVIVILLLAVGIGAWALIGSRKDGAAEQNPGLARPDPKAAKTTSPTAAGNDNSTATAAPASKETSGDSPKDMAASFMLGRWRSKTSQLVIEFKQTIGGIEGVIVRVPESWPERVKPGDTVFTEGKASGDMVEGLYLNLPQRGDCPSLPAKFSKCVIKMDRVNNELNVTNTPYKYAHPACRWSDVTYEDSWTWYR